MPLHGSMNSNTHQWRLDELNVEAEDGATVRVQLQDPNGRHDAEKLLYSASRLQGFLVLLDVMSSFAS